MKPAPDAGFFSAAITLIMSAATIAVISAMLLAVQLAKDRASGGHDLAARYAAQSLLIKTIVEIDQARRPVGTWNGAERREVFGGYVAAVVMRERDSDAGSVCADALHLDRLSSTGLIVIAGAANNGAVRPSVAVALLDSVDQSRIVAQRLIVSPSEVSRCTI